MDIRVDVVSLKGGAGKTTVAFRLAWAQAQKSGRPVLMVDADFAGACLGDLLEGRVECSWGDVPNLADLVCDRPEMLAEQLASKDRFPVYRLRPAPPPGVPYLPSRVTSAVPDACVLFCPSHSSSSVADHVAPTLLHALVAHESAGGWVEHAIEMVIERTVELAGSLGGVIVDHSPGLSALPWAVLRAIRASEGDDRKACFLLTPDLVDLKAWFATRSRADTLDLLDALEKRSAWVVNRLLPPGKGQREDVRSRIPPETPAGAWLDSAFALPHDDNLAKAYAKGGLVQLIAHEDRAIEPLRAFLFDKVAP